MRYLLVPLLALWVGLALGADLPTGKLHKVQTALRPDPTLTPGRTADTDKDVCATKWGRDARHVTEAMKREVYARYGLTNHRGICARSPRGCEVDHLISRELLGADVIENLWIQPYGGPWNAVMKDALENRLHKLVCAGEIDLETAQREIATDWVAAYRARMPRS